MLNITKGRIDRPVKCVIYGPEGIGKSTLASKSPNALFEDVEGGTAQMDVPRLDRPEKWEKLIADIKEVAASRWVQMRFSRISGSGLKRWDALLL